MPFGPSLPTAAPEIVISIKHSRLKLFPIDPWKKKLQNNTEAFAISYNKALPKK